MSWFAAHLEALRRRCSVDAAFVFACAILVGFCSALPSALAVRSAGDAYRGMPFLYADDEDVYLARMQEIEDGHPAVGSVYFFEYKDQVPVQPPVGEWAYVLLSRLTGLPLPQTLVLAKFLLPMALFLLVYVFVRRLLPEESPPWAARMAAAAIGVAICLAYDPLSLADLAHLWRGEPIGLRLSVWTRPVNPIFGGLLVFGFLSALWLALETSKRRWLSEMVAAALFAASVFYFFSWGILMSVSAFLGLGFLMAKDWPRLKRLAATLAAGFLLSLPYWVSLWHSMGQGEDGRRLALRNGLLLGHGPLLNKTLLAAMVAFVGASAWIARRDRAAWLRLLAAPWWRFSAALLLGGFLALNQQVVTGRAVWPYHFVQYTKPFALIVTGVVLFRLAARRPRAAKAAAAALLSLSVAQSAAAAMTFREVMGDFRFRQQEAELFRWMGAHVPKDCVVLVTDTHEYLPRQVPAFTSCDGYVVPWVINGVPDDRIRHNFFVFLRLSGVTAADAEAYLRVHHGLVRGYFFADWKQMFETWPDAWSDRMAADLAAGYAEFLEVPFRDQLAKYRLDYVLSRGPADPALAADIGSLEEVAVFGELHLYVWKQTPPR